MVSRLLERYKAKSPLLDIGCGSGYQWPGYEVWCVDADGLAVARAKEKGLYAVKASACALPFGKEKFRTVLMLDVLEHVENDLLALQEASRVLENGGLAIISVPLYQSLWSEHDVKMGHRRRYGVKQIASLLQRAGFKIAYSTRWNSMGLPGACLRKMGFDINGAAGKAGPLMFFEARLATFFPFPLGLSGFWVAVKT
ncbi:class I SAM-dependent methyltransferase [Moorella naiadis]|uniref:class I SAM-dependent methyltransferase n=1 Tax=Moorella naiadis (nom. illeg.) TaxID=3093670 RepID=UPI003D9C7D5B